MMLRRPVLLLLVALAACGSDAFDAPDAPGAASTAPAGSRNLARTGKRTRGSNSQLVIPGNLLLADVDGDGTSDLVRFEGNDVSVASTSFEQTPMLHLFTGRPVKRVLTGDFHGDRRDQVCVVTDDNGLSCYGISSDRRALWWWFTQGTFVGDNEDAIVADYDGDGRDDVLVYPRGGGAYRMYSIKGDHFFAATPSFAPGNLGNATAGLQLRAGDFDGNGRDDLLIVNSFGQVLDYASVWDGSSHTFWWAFTSAGGVVGADDQVTIARIDDDLGDDLVLRNRASGATRFHRVDYGDGRPPAITNVALGQLSTVARGLVFWGAMHGPVAEPGASTRDDALVYDPGSAMFVRSDARWDGAQLTYWWAYTQFVPGAGPVDGSARTGGAPALVKAYTEHLGRLTGAPPNDFGGNLGIVGTDLGVSYEAPGGLAFLFGDSWTVVPGVRQDEDSFGTTTASSVGHAAMPFISWARGAFGAFRAFVVPGVPLGGMNVPVEGLALGNTHYVFFDSGWNGTRHTRSILAHFDGSNPGAMIKDHDVVSDKFINFSVVNEGNMLYLFGNGHYRQSPVYLARVEPWNLGDRSRWSYFRGMRRGEAVFGPGESSAVELVGDRCVGELSVRKHPTRPLYLMAYNCDNPRGIRLRTAPAPTGPWSDGQVIFDPGPDRGYEHFMHASEAAIGHDDGLAEPYGSSSRRDEWGGEYGPYLVPRWFRSEANGVEKIVYTLSSWNPYQIHLMETVLVPAGTSYTPPPRGLGLPRTSLVNGDFAARDVRGWGTTGDGASFPVFTGSDGRPRLTTYTPARGDAATGSIYQDFTVDLSTRELRFKLHGGDGGTIKLYRGGELLRRSQGRRTNDVETEVIWKLEEYRGDTLRIVVEDGSTAPWGFVGLSGIEFR